MKGFYQILYSTSLRNFFVSIPRVATAVATAGAYILFNTAAVVLFRMMKSNYVGLSLM